MQSINFRPHAGTVKLPGGQDAAELKVTNGVSGLEVNASSADGDVDLPVNAHGDLAVYLQELGITAQAFSTVESVAAVNAKLLGSFSDPCSTVVLQA